MIPWRRIETDAEECRAQHMDSLVYSRKAASSMAQKGKKEKGSGGAAAAEAPPERDVIPGKITESQW